MTKTLLILLTLLMVNQFGFGQETGKLIISTNFSEDRTTDKIDFFLVKKDSIYKQSSRTSLYNDEWEIDSLAAGIYQFKASLNDTAFFTFYKVVVEAKKNNTYDFNFDVHRRKTPNNTPKADSLKINYHEDHGEVSLSNLYGNNASYIKTPSQQNELYSGEIAMNMYHSFSKHYSLGMKIGGQYSRTIFYNDHRIINNEKILSKYYSYADVNIGIVNRFMFYNNRIPGKNGLKLDLGILYHFPLAFKETFKLNYDTKTSTRHIHTYTDFTAMARLVYKHVGIQAEYSITNFLKYYYTEIPQLRFGLVFYIPAIVN